MSCMFDDHKTKIVPALLVLFLVFLAVSDSIRTLSLPLHTPFRLMFSALLFLLITAACSFCQQVGAWTVRNFAHFWSCYTLCKGNKTQNARHVEICCKTRWLASSIVQARAQKHRAKATCGMPCMSTPIRPVHNVTYENRRAPLVYLHLQVST